MLCERLEPQFRTVSPSANSRAKQIRSMGYSPDICPVQYRDSVIVDFGYKGFSFPAKVFFLGKYLIYFNS